MLFGNEKDLVTAPGVGIGAPLFCVLASTAAASTAHDTVILSAQPPPGPHLGLQEEEKGGMAIAWGFQHRRLPLAYVAVLSSCGNWGPHRPLLSPWVLWVPRK